MSELFEVKRRGRPTVISGVHAPGEALDRQRGYLSRAGIANIRIKSVCVGSPTILDYSLPMSIAEFGSYSPL